MLDSILLYHSGSLIPFMRGSTKIKEFHIALKVWGSLQINPVIEHLNRPVQYDRPLHSKNIITFNLSTLGPA